MAGVRCFRRVNSRRPVRWKEANVIPAQNPSVTYDWSRIGGQSRWRQHWASVPRRMDTRKDKRQAWCSPRISTVTVSHCTTHDLVDVIITGIRPSTSDTLSEPFSSTCLRRSTMLTRISWQRSWLSSVCWMSSSSVCVRFYVIDVSVSRLATRRRLGWWRMLVCHIRYAWILNRIQRVKRYLPQFPLSSGSSALSAVPVFSSVVFHALHMTNQSGMEHFYRASWNVNSV